MALAGWRDSLLRLRSEATLSGVARRDAESNVVRPAVAQLAGAHRGLRRALWGAAGVGALDALPPGLPAPRADEDHLWAALWATRRGASPEEARTQLAALDQRTLLTAWGRRSPAQALARTPLRDRFDAIWPLVAPAREAQAAGRAASAAGSRWVALAAHRHPDDFPRLLHAREAAGRREDHTLLDALGQHGDPRALPVLRDALHARDVDPGRGFIQRRLAADALGRLGLAAATPLLVGALRDERHDFEGRPGAGLGIQYPVRANLLWALGELGDEAAIPALLAHLDDSHGSAFGGFYLPAMDALVRVGNAAAVRDALPGLGEAGAANAVGVLLALGDPPARWRDHPVAAVRAVAALAEPSS